MSEDWSKGLCKFYKGEAECPYNQDTQRDQYMFWFYEKKFGHDFFETQAYKGENVEQAFAGYLERLFQVLSDKYGGMDDGTLFKEIYERLDP